ncbi:uroporphyrinogen-III synthase isoform X1 [Bombyx mori]|uniref:Uroporphyrinogen-III synthase n=1 Tax=Bombyx mori TaxID=7091 RepID=A0A8R1WKT2_BOMMO|nr:uroporphyrinogen-III synthase isoform X1 [Bombyx mori]
MMKIVLFKGESEDYQRIFRENNFETIFVEPLQFIYINIEELSQKLLQNDYDGMILTSPRAVEAVSKCWDPTKFVIWNSKDVYTVGEMSSQKIKLLLGLDALGATAGNAENLSKIILKDKKKTSTFLFPCGNLRSETIPNMLQSEGITLDAITVYETQENENLKALLMELNNLNDSPSGLAFFSPSGCEYIHRQLQTFSNRLSLLPHFAIGNSTAHKIENLGVEIAGVAAKPKAESLVESVLKYFALQGS